MSGRCDRPAGLDVMDRQRLRFAFRRLGRASQDLAESINGPAVDPDSVRIAAQALADDVKALQRLIDEAQARAAAAVSPVLA
jgi:regulator of protease activity HflC (stomatin/prohibitin superfamily)